MNAHEINRKLFNYIKSAPTAFHAVDNTSKMLESDNFLRLGESKSWNLIPGGKYYVTRNNSSIIAFRLPKALPTGFMITAAHGDSPCFKIKENSESEGKNYIRFSTEKYGGMLCSSWLDRPLSIAGRVIVRTDTGISTKLVDFEEPMAIIPNLAIHMNRNANDGASFNAASDMLPLYGIAGKTKKLRTRIAEAVGVDEGSIISTDLFAYNPQNGIEWNGFISSPRLDDLQCAFSSLSAFINADIGKSSSASVYCLFDNEEVGSQTKQGAASTFLSDIISRIASSLGLNEAEKQQLISSSFMVSCDNAHAIHPNHPEFSDANHTSVMNGGIVIKYNANQKYTSDAVSSAVFKLICEKANVPCQTYANRADMAGGSTLGNIANTQLSLNTVDIGLAQLAMHSAFETAGADDTAYMIKALTVFFENALVCSSDGEYTLI